MGEKMVNKIDTLLNFKDASGTVNEIYPITKKKNVQGLEEYISNLLSGYLPKSGGTMTGPLMVDGKEDNIFYAMKVAKDKFLTGIQNNDKKERGTIEISPPAIRLTIGSESVENYLNVTPAGIFTNKNIDIIQDNQLTTKEYVDSLKPKTKTVTLSSTGWTASGDVYTQAVTISGVSATETEQEIHVTPATASMTAYMESGVYASAQAANQITFTASEKPTVDLTVYVVIKAL
nr:MAG TPA: hypothetical protein [Caudoviricetes sp.]